MTESFVKDFGPDTSDEKFHHWSDLPERVKFMILDYLPFTTHRNFLFLSKECYSLVSRFKYESFALYLDEEPYASEYQDDPPTEESVDVLVDWIPPDTRTDPHSYERYHLKFVEDKHGGCLIRKAEEKIDEEVSKTGVRYRQSRFSAAVRAFFKFATMLTVQEMNVILSKMSPEIEGVLLELPETTMLSCSQFHMTTDDPKLVAHFLRFLHPGCALSIYTHLPDNHKKTFVDRSFFNTELARRASSLELIVRTDVTDDQLLSLQGKNIHLIAPGVTSQAVNQLVLQWFEGKRKISHISLIGMRSALKSEIFHGVDPAKLLTWEEVLQVAPNKDWLRTYPFSADNGGIRNRAGVLLLLMINSKSCDLINAHD